MKPLKEKAEELIEKANKVLGYYHYHISEETKELALLIVDEILEATKVRKAKLKPNTVYFYYEYSEYWQKVKKEIEKL